MRQREREIEKRMGRKMSRVAGRIDGRGTFCREPRCGDHWCAGHAGEGFAGIIFRRLRVCREGTTVRSRNFFFSVGSENEGGSLI